MALVGSEVNVGRDDPAVLILVEDPVKMVTMANATRIPVVEGELTEPN